MVDADEHYCTQDIAFYMGGRADDGIDFGLKYATDIESLSAGLLVAATYSVKSIPKSEDSPTSAPVTNNQVSWLLAESLKVKGIGHQNFTRIILCTFHTFRRGWRQE